MTKAELRDKILTHIAPPIIPERYCLARDFHVTPNITILQTSLLQDAIDQVSRTGGGHLVLSAGNYKTGALQLRDGVDLHLDAGATLSFIPDEPEKNYPLAYSHWEASPCWNFSALLYAIDAHDIAVTGAGILDGCASRENWWRWHHQVENAWSKNLPDLQLPDRKALRDMNQNAVPVEQRVFGAGHYLRPNFIQLIRCDRMLLQGFTLKNSPMWQINPVFCSSVTIEGLTLSSHGPNNDGCDPESCNGVWIKNCTFDTGDDCISLKSGRDLDGRKANTPCQNVLIENNNFADGHGGVALGSEMSGGIQRVLADKNYFSSPHLTYALRMKTNARRGGFIREVMLCDSVMDHVHGAAVHGTMLYEDGRNGDSLPVFQDIVIEKITAHGGDYGIFLEAFPEVPITGLVLRDIQIDGAQQELRSMNWVNPVIDKVIINGKEFPRPCRVRILGVPQPGNSVKASAESCGEAAKFKFIWEISSDGRDWREIATGESIVVPQSNYLRLQARDSKGNCEVSRSYRIIPECKISGMDDVKLHLMCRGLTGEILDLSDNAFITRRQAAELLFNMTDGVNNIQVALADTTDPACVKAVANKYFALDQDGRFLPEERLTRQELATVAMQSCGVNYRNASTTMPVCQDVKDVWNSFGTNVARALYFNFMELEDGNFYPLREVTVGEFCQTLAKVADFAGL